MPEVGALAGSAKGAPSAAEEREVQENDGIGSSEANLDGIVGAKVAIHDPCRFGDKLLLH
jgi:hypothetical protein